MRTLVCELDCALSKTTLTTELFIHKLRLNLVQQFSAISGHSNSREIQKKTSSQSIRLPLNSDVERLVNTKKDAGYDIIVISDMPENNEKLVFTVLMALGANGSTRSS